MSADWERYSTARECRDRAANPAENGVITLVAEGVRSIPELTVVHEPDHAKENRAHTNIRGLDDHGAQTKTRIRTRLFQMFHEWEITPGAG